MTPTIGRIVHYRLSQADAEVINRRRVDAAESSVLALAGMKTGAQAHIGNTVYVAYVVTMMVTAVVHDGRVNGQLILDGNDSLWVKGADRGAEPAQWDWPPHMANKPENGQAGSKRETTPHEIDVLLAEVTPGMQVEGACILEAWLEGDEDFKGLSSLSIVGMIYSRMRQRDAG